MKHTRAFRIVPYLVIVFFISILTFALSSSALAATGTIDANSRDSYGKGEVYGDEKFGSDIYIIKPDGGMMVTERTTAYRTADGKNAYCLSLTKAGPNSGTYQWTGDYLSDLSASILELGFPNSLSDNPYYSGDVYFDHEIQGISLTEMYARQATQIALWVAADDKDGNPPLEYGSTVIPNPDYGSAYNTYEASRLLFEAAKSHEPTYRYKIYYDGGDKNSHRQWIAVAEQLPMTG